MINLQNLEDDITFFNPKWESNIFATPTKNQLELVIEGKSPGILSRNFLNSETCDELVRNIVTRGFKNYSHVEANVGTFGLVQMEYNTTTTQFDYFNKVQKMNYEYLSMLKILPSPMDLVINFLKNLSNRACFIANEPNLGSYFAGTFRHVKGAGLIHFDYAPVETKNLIISQISNQLSWNLYLSEPTEGGELVIYEQQWHKGSEKYKSEGYWYNNAAVAEGKHITYFPKRGDLVIFNSRNFHEIKHPKGDRFTMSSFIGLNDHNQFIFWS